jgi:cob(I)alamin adenosyltransferase
MSSTNADLNNILVQDKITELLDELEANLRLSYDYFLKDGDDVLMLKELVDFMYVILQKHNESDFDFYLNKTINHLNSQIKIMEDAGLQINNFKLKTGKIALSQLNNSRIVCKKVYSFLKDNPGLALEKLMEKVYMFLFLLIRYLSI